MEFFQIIANLSFLGVLAWWVMREKKREVSREEFEKTYCVAAKAEDRVTAYHGYWQKEFTGVIDRLSRLESPKSTGTEIADAIKTGAAMAQHHIDTGAKLVLDALARDGRVAPASYDPPKEAVNLDEDEYSFAPQVTTAMPDIIMARNEKHAEQIGDRVLEELMRGIK